MLASLHLADVGPPTALRLLAGGGPDPERVPGLRYATTVAAAPLGRPGPAVPQPRRVGLIALWDDDEAIEAFDATHPVAAALAGGWRARLATLAAHDYRLTRGEMVRGAWPGVEEETSDTSDSTGPIVSLTLARTRTPQALRLLRATLAAGRPMGDAAGLLWGSALARPPIIATCTLWSSAAAVEAYAYGPRGSGHRVAMEADRKRAMHHEGVFFRFRPLTSIGALQGRNPLDGSCLLRGTEAVAS